MPSVFCIGAPRSGTTALHQHLALHPEICVSWPKEPNYFTANFGQGKDWYSRFFPHNAKVTIDFSTSYSHYLNCPVVERIYAYAPEAKFIFLLRDPLDRLVSNYKYNWVKNGYRASFAQAAYQDYLLVSSLYYYTIFRFLRRFPLERFHLINTRSLQIAPVDVLSKLYDFLKLRKYAPIAVRTPNSIDHVAKETSQVIPPIAFPPNLQEQLWFDLSYDWNRLSSLTAFNVHRWETNPLWQLHGKTAFPLAKLN